MLHHVLLYDSAAALSLAVTALIVAGNQRFLPRALVVAPEGVRVPMALPAAKQRVNALVGD
jgi:hypothetical protein